MGRVSVTTNPFRENYPAQTNDGNAYPTYTGYDVLGRVVNVTMPDGSNEHTDRTGNIFTVRDAAKNQRKYTYDALGRLTSVLEDPASLNYQTTYTYDALDNLTKVTQGGQTRTFNYDSLRRLISSVQPETGAINYHYDADGNLVWHQDNAGRETCYKYDSLNRLSYKIYYTGDVSAAAAGNCAAVPESSYLSPPVTYTYDNTAVTYGIGRLTKVSNEISTTNILAYDALGRVTASQQVTAGQTYNFGYTWDLAGALTSERYPSGRTIQTAYDSANRVSGVTGVWDQQAKTYLSGVKYAPHGQPDWFLYGNNLCRAFTYNNRLQPVSSVDSEQPNPPGSATDCTNLADQHLVLNWAWGLSATQNNGNLREMDAWHGGPAYPQFLAFSETFQYDHVNRLTSATDSGGWSRQYAYDQYGNMWVPNGAGVLVSPQTPPLESFIDKSTNRIGGATSYDTAGNQTRVLNSSQIASFDPENRVSQVVDTAGSGGKVSYIYDGNGQRVQKVFSDGSTETYVYDILGRLAAEYSSNPTTTAPPCKTCYLSTDHLGSTRLVTGDNGAIIARHDYLPFGEEVLAGYASRRSEWGGADRANQKFTSKERDSETGLDFFGARHMSAAQGRFTAPDPISGTVLHILNPQRWNMYVYAVNSPLLYIDPDGRDAIAVKFGNGAHGLGHAGVASVHHDGKGTFADFAPQHAGSLHDTGRYTFRDYETKLGYGADGKPTKESLSALANELADNEQQTHDSVSVAYFKTSDAETAALDAYIDAARAQQAKEKQPTYWGGFRDCISFCMNGLQKAGVGQGSSILTIPNLQYLHFWLWADQTATGTNPKSDPERDRQLPHDRCLQTRDGNCAAQ